MRVTRLEAWSVPMPLSEPYTIAYETVDSTTNVFLRLHTDTPHIGVGCAAPDRYITGETHESVLSVLQQLPVNGLDPTRPAAAYRRLVGAVGVDSASRVAMPSAMAALDMALFDLLGRACDLPLWKLLGGARASIQAGMTIGIHDERETVAEARRWTAEGFAFLKLKGGLDPAADVARTLKVRETVGGEIRLAFDANGGYTVEQSRTFLAGCTAAGLEFLEQPTPREHPEWLAEVQQSTPLPIMADECLTTPGQALGLARGVRLFNIKLMKVGGVHPALAIDGVAESAGVGVMVGCLDESALAIAAGLHFALARPNVRYADLDAHFALVGDPTAGAVILRDGVLYPNAGPGLGVRLR